MSPPEIYFFGCRQYAGHFLWTPKMERLGRISTLKICEALGGGVAYDLDAGFAPKDPKQIEGRAAVHNLKSGWTVVAWWDRSVDNRFGSNSALIMRGTHTLSEVLLAAADQFPELLPRFAGLVVAA